MFYDDDDELPERHPAASTDPPLGDPGKHGYGDIAQVYRCTDSRHQGGPVVLDDLASVDRTSTSDSRTIGTGLCLICEQRAFAEKWSKR